MIHFNPRHLRAFVAVARTGSVARAADVVSRVQSAITHAIQELESDLGVVLFDRLPQGMRPTEFGLLLHARAEAVFRELDAARAVVQRLSGQQRWNPNAPIFTLGIGRQRLLVFTELMKLSHMGAVARQFGISQPAVSLALREVEQGVGQPLVRRTAGGIVPNPMGEQLAMHLRRALVEMAKAEEEIAARQSGIEGQVAVGTLSLGRSWLLPRAIIQMAQVHPGIKVATIEGSFEHLATLLRAGEIDFMLGGLRPEEHLAGLASRPVVRSDIVLLGRRGHPCCDILPREGWPALERARWVLPNPGTWTRSALETALAGHGLPPPEVVVETADVVITRALLLASDLVTAASPHLFRDEIASGDLVVLPLAPDTEPRDIGIVTRADGMPTVASRLLMAAIAATGAAGG